MRVDLRRVCLEQARQRVEKLFFVCFCKVERERCCRRNYNIRPRIRVADVSLYDRTYVPAGQQREHKLLVR